VWNGRLSWYCGVKGMAFRARIPWGNGRLLRLLCTRIGFRVRICTERLSSPSVLSRNDCVLSRFCCNDA
jgi:hypothetical protein